MLGQLLILKISLEYLLKELFPDALEPLSGKVLFCVRDDHGRVVFGAPVGQPGKFLYERAFPTTLYLWRLQLAPLQVAEVDDAGFGRAPLPGERTAAGVAAAMAGYAAASAAPAAGFGLMPMTRSERSAAFRTKSRGPSQSKLR